MRTVLFLCFLGSCLLAPSAAAEEAAGRVRGVYYEVGRGVLVDASFHRSPSARRWVDVELVGDYPEPRKRQLVLMPQGMTAGVGDMVALRLGDPKATQLTELLPSLAVNRALAVNPQAPRFAGAASTGASTVKP